MNYVDKCIACQTQTQTQGRKIDAIGQTEHRGTLIQCKYNKKVGLNKSSLYKCIGPNKLDWECKAFTKISGASQSIQSI